MTGSDGRLRELARRTPNFGYLLPYHGLLVTYGAMAEASIFTDSNTAMIKCRQFAEALGEQAFIAFGIPDMPDKQYRRINLLRDQGFVDQRVGSWFDAVRLKGNKANHEGYEGQRDALLVVRACYELGAWFHRTRCLNGSLS